ncbi:hypothetical protein QCA50_008774 [Cerrena zonata]|uniref:Fungal-type protein kinase domain-containing protein n=1 Tax=Cerrena zonata TaxID=2478898 RepID=A0AAW0G4Z0_9APHY
MLSLPAAPYVSSRCVCIFNPTNNCLQGTWQFISIPLLDDAKKAHDIFDDLESLLWVLLFFAVHYFKYRGAFNMRVFNEVCEYSDETNGTILMGGDSKLRWLQSPRITFECKPLQAFFNSFRSFHRERHWKIALSTDNEEEKKVLEDYEAETQKDIYKLVSHFDNILNDPNTDWSGQDAIGILPEEIPPPEDDKPDEEMDEPEVHPQPIPEVKGPQAKGKRGQKRTRDNLGPEDDNDRRRKRIATSKSNEDRGTEGMGKSVTHARRRRIPAAPCNRVLRPQTRQ